MTSKRSRTGSVWVGVLVGGMISASALTPSSAWAWGSYGHQQIQLGALDLIKGTPMGDCLNQARNLVLRYSITPDYDWKAVGPKPSSDPNDPVLQAWYRNDSYEHPLHFFEVDAFLKNPNDPVATEHLPASVNYFEVLEAYRALLAANSGSLAQLEPGKPFLNPAHPTNMEVAQRGTAPWRIVQLYDLGVQALKSGNTAQAVYLLGSMGHYIGDMAQPFHGTVRYDGAARPPSQGVHHTYEEAILEISAGPNAGRDSDGVWDSFASTSQAVDTVASQTLNSIQQFPREAIVSYVLKLLASGQGLVNPLTKLFAEECARFNGRAKPRFCVARQNTDPSPHPSNPALAVTTTGPNTSFQPSVPKALMVNFMNRGVPGTNLTVFQTAEKRMGQGAALLARMWLQAFKAAGSPPLSGCQRQFNRADAILQYPLPVYLPDDAQRKLEH